MPSITIEPRDEDAAYEDERALELQLPCHACGWNYDEGVPSLS